MGSSPTEGELFYISEDFIGSRTIENHGTGTEIRYQDPSALP